MLRFANLLAFSAILLAGSVAFATPCDLPGYGDTSSFPPPCPEGYQGPMAIIDGLPPGTTIEIQATLRDFLIQFEEPGGSLGGHRQVWDATLVMDMTGTGDLAGFTRHIEMPTLGETHTGPRIPGEPLQDFDTDLFQLQGQILGDPDFDNLVVFAGQSMGLPCPGHCTVAQLPGGDWNVDSFFDITYQIEFTGAPGSALDGLMGATPGSDRFVMGEPLIPEDTFCVLPDNGGGTVDFPPDCPDGYVGTMVIIDGLPAGTTIEIDASLRDFIVTLEGPGGILDGEFQIWDATLVMDMTGTGDLAGFSRHMEFFASGETNTGPRDGRPDPFQEFLNELMRMNAEKYGDPDFGIIKVSAGTELGLPSPGHTILSPLPGGNFNVDSFFDITYEFEFEGAPGSALEGFAGTTTGTDRFIAGSEYIPDESCNLPDDGNGSVNFPPECPDGYKGELKAVEGLPPGTIIAIEAALKDFGNINRTPINRLGAEGQTWDATLHMIMTGTGDLAGFQREIQMPVSGETETGWRGEGDIQSFSSELVHLEGLISGDPDFDLLALRAGGDFGLPSPGHSVLTKLSEDNWQVDSFFDVTYEIDFVGAPGSILDGLAGTTLRTSRFEIGNVGLVAVEESTPVFGFALFANAPNPFNPVTKISYFVPEGGGQVRLDIFDIAGRRVRMLADEFQSGGLKTVQWDGRNEEGVGVSSGVYFYRLRATKFSEARKMTVLK